jgi:catalase
MPLSGDAMTGLRDDTALARATLDETSGVMGSVPGHRVTHTKGVLLTGTFTATPQAKALTRAVHMQGDPVRVTVRFSNGSGNPRSSDAAVNDPRGMAVKFYLPDGSETDLALQTWPVFPAATPEEFHGLMKAQNTGTAATEEYLAGHPHIAAALDAIAALGDPPLAWGRTAFNSMNAYRLVNADGATQLVRFRLEPVDGVAGLPADQWETADEDYLMDGVLEQVPVRHRLLAQLAGAGDQTVDPSRAWPADREWVDLGLVECTGPDTERERDGDVLVNDPTRVTDGIELSDDPILAFRYYVYADSVRRRTGG